MDELGVPDYQFTWPSHPLVPPVARVVEPRDLLLYVAIKSLLCPGRAVGLVLELFPE